MCERTLPRLFVLIVIQLYYSTNLIRFCFFLAQKMQSDRVLLYLAKDEANNRGCEQQKNVIDRRRIKKTKREIIKI